MSTEMVREGDKVALPDGRVGVVLRRRSIHLNALVLVGDDTEVFNLDQITKLN